jgi:nucleoside-diphosphate-sugar epimerase
MHLAQALVQKGHDVTGVVRYATSRNNEELKPFLKGVKLLTADISDYQAISGALKMANPDVVVHLAAMSPVRESFDRPFGFVEANVTGTLNIVHAMMELPEWKKRKLIYASTAEVYGPQDKPPLHEKMTLNPYSPYAVTKEMTDIYLRNIANNVYGLNTTVMRCTNSYGRKMETGFFVEYCISALLKGEKVYVGAPESVRDYMYIDDHVNAYLKAIEHKDVRGEAFSFGTGKGISNKDCALLIADMMGFDKKHVVIGEYPPTYPSRPLVSDQPFIVMDYSKAKKMLGWEPKVDLKHGLKLSIDYWKKKMGKAA